MLSWIVSCFRRRRCKKVYVALRDATSLRAQFEHLCHVGDMKGLEEFNEFNEDLVDVNKGLILASGSNQKAVVVWCLEKGAKELDNALKVACQNNYRDIAELLAEKGADLNKGLGVAKSTNIINMLCEIRNRREREHEEK